VIADFVALRMRRFAVSLSGFMIYDLRERAMLISCDQQEFKILRSDQNRADTLIPAIARGIPIS